MKIAMAFCKALDIIGVGLQIIVVDLIRRQEKSWGLQLMEIQINIKILKF